MYEAPREVLEKLDVELSEMKSCKQKGLCCGAGGAQMFKEAEKGDKEINIKRTEEALETKPDIIAAGCPFCNTMLTDGVKNKKKEDEIKVMDIAELIKSSHGFMILPFEKLPDDSKAWIYQSSRKFLDIEKIKLVLD